MRQETTSGGEKHASGAGAEKKGWRRIVSIAGPVAVGVAGLAAAAGVGYVQGEKAGAARAVAHEIFTREHKELREIEAGVARVKETIAKIRAAESGDASTAAPTDLKDPGSSGAAVPLGLHPPKHTGGPDTLGAGER